MEKERQVGIVIPEDLIKKIQEEANKQDRSLSAQVRYILKQWAGETEEER